MFEGYEDGYKIVENIVEYEGESVYEYTLEVIPEPASVAAMFGMAVLAFAAYRRRRS